MNWLVSVFAISAGYLLGSIPSALIVSRVARGVDIRTLGDGNMGARNTARNLGTRYGVVVAVADFCKAAVAVLIARWLGQGDNFQMLAGAAAILGHDFPVFAGFRGGQGLAATLGAMVVLFPTQTLIGLMVYGMLYMITRKPDLSASIGCGLLALILGLQSQWHGLIFIVILLLLIPLKQWLDSPRRKQINESENKKSQV